MDLLCDLITPLQLTNELTEEKLDTDVMPLKAGQCSCFIIPYRGHAVA
jgi:hypothetical protein